MTDSIIYFTVFTIIYLVAEVVYFRFADKYNIIDKPNLRSSHTAITIRGGGIIFPIAFIIPIFFADDAFSYWPLLTGVLLISTIGFLDDIKPLTSTVRITFHFIAVGLLLYQSGLFLQSLWWLLPAFILVAGIINAYNFMDGINGMTVLYSMCMLVTLFWISENTTAIMQPMIFVSIISSLLVFGWFNLRKKAKCFAGDVGSVSIAFILVYLVITLILKANDLKWLLLFGVYGLDSVATLFLRILRKENIFQPHRTHYYQFLANEKKMPHVVVASIYSGVQILLNYVIISGSLNVALICYIALVLTYIILRLLTEGRMRLFNIYVVKKAR